MTITLLLLWVGVCGGVMILLRKKIALIVQLIPIPWQIKFFLFTILLILIEEAITTTLTNLASNFGGIIGKAYITASTNYFHVVLFHSAISFVPWIIVLLFYLSKYDIPALDGFVVFGILGTVAETMINPYALVAGFWIFVYGFMVYLPLYSLPKRRDANKPSLLVYVSIIFVSLLVSIPWILMVMYVRNVLQIPFFF